MIDRGREEDRAGEEPTGSDAMGRATEGGPGGFEAMGRAIDPEVWEILAGWRAEGRNFALLTVIESRAFTPRKAGAHMLVDERGETFGTIGGGAIEHEALRHARCLLESGGGSTAVKRHLTQEL